VVRTAIYCVLGFFIFGIAGIILGSVIYPGIDPHESAVHAFEVGGLVGLAGVVCCIWLSRWMAKKGEQKLRNFSQRPLMMWGVSGALFGAFIMGVIVPKYFPSPTTGFLLAFLIATPIVVALSAWITLKTARTFNFAKLDLPVNVGPTSSTSASNKVTYWVTLFIAAFVLVFLLLAHQN